MIKVTLILLTMVDGCGFVALASVVVVCSWTLI